MSLVLPRVDMVAQTVYWLMKEEHDAKPGAVPMAAFEELDPDVRAMHMAAVERVYRAIDRCVPGAVDVVAEAPRPGVAV